MDLSIIIVTHNSAKPVRACLTSLGRHPPTCEHEVVVVDNASADGTPEMISGRFPSVHLEVNEENKGYSRAVNQGIARACGNRILIINPDIEVREGSIDRLMAFMDRTPDAGIAGAQLVYPDGRLQYSCRSFYTVSALFLRRTFLGKLFPRAKALREHLLLDDDHEESRRVDWVLGACMLVRREAMEQVGLMDERFFLYFEDTDWCFRMKKQGWAVYYVPESIMIHRYERSSAGSIWRKPFLIHLLSLLRYYEKWNDAFYFLRRHRGMIKTTTFIFSDLAMINGCFFAAYAIRGTWLQPFFTNRLYPVSWYLVFILFYNLIYFLTFLAGGLYRIRRETPALEEFLKLVRAIVLGLLILLASTYLARVRIHSRAVVLGQAFLSVFAVFGMRELLRILHRQLVMARFDLKRVLLLGSQEEMHRYRELLTVSPDLGIDPIVYVGDGTAADLADTVRRFTVQEVLVLPSFGERESLLPLVSGRVVQFRFVSPIARFLGTGGRVEEIAGIPLFAIERSQLFMLERALKRAGDVCAAVVMFPFVSILSACYRIYGRVSGKVRFYSEVRRGRGGSELHWPRSVDTSGREAGDFLKHEFCVRLLRGDLSLVGPPAPLPSWEQETVMGHGFNFRPGITGSWRIDPGIDRLAAVHNEFVDLMSWSLTREILIMAQSLKYMLSGTYPDWFYEQGRER